MKWSEISARAGRNEYPELLAMAVLMHDTLTDSAEIAIGIHLAWSSAEFPERYLDRGIWLMLFRRVGFIEDDRVAKRPDTPVIVYRGAIPANRFGMSWTDDRERAEWFARRFDALGANGRLYTLTVPSRKLLARVTVRNESEWVVDTTEITQRIRLADRE